MLMIFYSSPIKDSNIKMFLKFLQNLKNEAGQKISQNESQVFPEPKQREMAHRLGVGNIVDSVV